VRFKWKGKEKENRVRVSGLGLAGVGGSKWRSKHLRLGRCTGERVYKY
jgi:hypothetical protein